MPALSILYPFYIQVYGRLYWTSNRLTALNTQRSSLLGRLTPSLGLCEHGSRPQRTPAAFWLQEQNAVPKNKSESDSIFTLVQGSTFRISNMGLVEMRRSLSSAGKGPLS